MKKRALLVRLLSLILACVLTGGLIVAFAASKAGTETDPLITLSYIDKVFKPQVLNAIDEAVEQVKNSSAEQVQPLLDAYLASIDDKLASLGTSAGAIAQNPAFIQMVQQAIAEKIADLEVITPDEDALYKPISLSAGQTLKASLGCEIILRQGTASVTVAGLVNLSKSGAALTVGTAVPLNNNLLAVTGGGAFRAATSATLLVRGSYTVE